MKGKHFKKVLAIVLTVAMLFTTLPIVAGAAEKLFEITHTSPAIPMNAGTTVDLTTLSVQMTAESNSFVSGSNLTWSVPDGTTGVILDNTAKTVTALNKGTAKLVVSDGTNTRNIWVVAKEKTETDFYLLNYDFTTDGYSSDDWAAIDWNSGGTGTALSITPSVNSDNSITVFQYLGSSQYTTIVNKNEIMKDFVDYALSAVVLPYVNNTNVWSGVGFVVGSDIDSETGVFAAGTPGYIHYFRMAEGIRICRIAAGKATYNGGYTCDDDLVNSSSGAYTLTSNSNYRTINAVYSADNFVMSMEDRVIFDFSRHTLDSGKTTADYHDFKGGLVGLYSWDTRTKVKSFSAKLTKTDMPDATDFTAYEVTNSTPAIPMNAGTTVDLSKLLVQMNENEDSFVYGANLTWEMPEDNANVIFDGTNKKVTALNKGTAKLTVKYGELTRNVWVVAKDAEDEKFYIADYDFTKDNYDPSEWTYFYYNDANDAPTNMSSDPTTNPGHIQINSDGAVILGPNNDKDSNNIWKVHGMLVNNNEIFKDFADYTVIVDAVGNADDGNWKAEATNTNGEWASFGPISRLVLNDTKDDIATRTTNILSSVIGRGDIRIHSTSSTDWWSHSPWPAGGYSINTGSDNQTALLRDNKTAETRYYTVDKDNHHTIKTATIGDSVAVSVDGISAFTTAALAEANDSRLNTWKAAENHAVHAGQAGFFTWGGKVKFYKFQVELDIDPANIPDSTPSTAYVVHPESPAIPMVKNTKVDLKSVLVKFSDEVTAAADSWESTNSAVYIDGTDLYARAAGTYKLTAKSAAYGDKTVYAVVATKADADKGVYKIYSYDFGEKGYDENEWKTDIAYAGTIEKNAIVWNAENNRYEANGVNSENASLNRNNLDANGNYTLNGPTNTVWKTDVRYYKANAMANSFDEAVSEGILSTTLTDKASQLGGFIPFALYSDAYKVTNVYDNVSSSKEYDTYHDFASETQSSAYMYSLNPIFNDFSNYTVTAELANGCRNYAGPQYGLLGRVTYTTAHIKDYMTIAWRGAHQTNVEETNYNLTYSAVNAAAGNTAGIFNRWGGYSMSVNTYRGVSDLSIGDSSSAEKATYSGFTGYDTFLTESTCTTLKTFTQKLQGDTITWSDGNPENTLVFNGKVVSSNGKVERTTATQTIPTNNGSIGLYVNMGVPVVGEISAKINEEYLTVLPASTAIENFIVNNGDSVAMKALTKINFNAIAFNFAENGLVPADTEGVTFVSGDTALRIENNAFAAYMTGNYSVTAKYNGETLNFTFAVGDDAVNAPSATDFAFYTVTKAAPAIPVNIYSKVSLSSFLIEVGDHTVLADHLELIDGVKLKPAADYQGVEYDEENEVLKIYSTGIFKFTVSYGSETQTVYVVSKETTDDSWTLYDVDFTDGETHTDWVSKYKIDNTQYGTFPSGTNYVSEMDEAYAARVSSTQNNYSANDFKGFAPYKIGYTDPKTGVQFKGWGKGAYVYLQNDIVSDFADYTVNTVAKSYPSAYGENWLVGRISLDSNGVFSTYTGFKTLGGHIHEDTQIGLYSLVNSTASAKKVWGYADQIKSGNDNKFKSVSLTSVYSGSTISISSPAYVGKVDSDMTDFTTVLGNGTIGYFVSNIIESGNTFYPNGTYGNSTVFEKVSVTLNNKANECPVAEELKLYSITNYDPVIVMNVNTKTEFSKLTVQFDNGETVLGSAADWSVQNANSTTGIEIKDGFLCAKTVGTYKITAKSTVDDGSLSIYVFVKLPETKTITLFSEDFSDHTIDYSVWQQVEYAFNEENQHREVVTSYNTPAKAATLGLDYFKNGVLGAVPFVLDQYWDARSWNGPRTYEIDKSEETGYDWFKIYSYNARKYLYLREDFVTADGVKLSDLGVYTVSASGNVLDNTSPYRLEKATATNRRMEYNGFGVIGRLDLGGKESLELGSASYTWFNSNSSTTIKDNDKTFNDSTKASANTGYLVGNVINFTVSATFTDNNVIGSTWINGTGNGKFDDALTVQWPNNKNNKGTVGVVSQARDVDLYEFTVTYPVTDMPETVDFFDTVSSNTVNVHTNTVTDFSALLFSDDSQSILGSNVAWDATPTANGEMVGDKFVAFKAGTATVTGTYQSVNGGSKTLSVTVNITDSSIKFDNSFVTVTGDGSIELSPKTITGQYTVTVTNGNGKLLKGGYISVTDGDNSYKLFLSDKNTATLSAVDLTNISLSAEFIGENDLSMQVLGATIRRANGTVSAGIRFGTRVNNIKAVSGTLAKADENIVINGVTYEPVSYGTVILPSALLDGELTVETAKAKVTQVTKVSLATENFSDVINTLTNIPENQYSTEVSFRTFVEYKNAQGDTFVAYSDTIERSYNDVDKLVPASYTGDEISVILTASKQNTAYDSGDNMVVSGDVYVNGVKALGLPVYLMVYSGTNSSINENDIEIGWRVTSSNVTPFKMSYQTSTDGYYWFVVSVLTPDGTGVIKRETIRLATGLKGVPTSPEAGTSTFDENNIVLNVGVTSDTHIEVNLTTRHNKHFPALIKAMNNVAGYNADGTQRLDALLVAGDLTNAFASMVNVTDVTSSMTDEEANIAYRLQLYNESKNFIDHINANLGSAQLFYCMGNHDTAGNGLSTNSAYAECRGKKLDQIRVLDYYKQVFCGADYLADGSALDLSKSKSYEETDEFIRFFGRDTETDQMYTYGNRAMQLNGYTFIALESTGLQNGVCRFSTATLNFLEDELQKSVARDPSAPIFIITHVRPDKHTVLNGEDFNEGSKMLTEILADYPQAIVWGGHVHDSLNYPAAIVQTATVDEDGNVLTNGYTSISSAVSSYTWEGTWKGGDNDMAQAQMIQVDINGNIRIIRIAVEGVDGTYGETYENEIEKNDCGQWVSIAANTAANSSKIKTAGDAWFIPNARDSQVRDTYTIARQAESKPVFTDKTVTLSGKNITFKQASNSVLNPSNEENGLIAIYRVTVYESDGVTVAQAAKSYNSGFMKYDSYADWKASADFSGNITLALANNPTSGQIIKIEAQDCWHRDRTDGYQYPVLTYTVS